MSSDEIGFDETSFVVTNTGEWLNEGLRTNLKAESNRLQTFHNWPSRAPVQAPELAASGLFFTGENDKVQCIFCNGFLHHWEEGDVAATEHRRHFPNCPFILGYNVDNIPLIEEMTSSSKDMNSGKEVDEEINEEFTHSCKICMNRQSDIVFIPCRHLVACQNCASRLKVCAVCRTMIRSTIKAYFC